MWWMNEEELKVGVERKYFAFQSVREGAGPIPPGLLPHGLRVLQVGDQFRSPLQPGSIPLTVEVLDLGRRYNHPLSGVLPPSLVHLKLGRRYNQPMAPGTLPPSLECLELSGDFDQPLGVGCLPSSLRLLRLSDSFEQLSPAGLVLPHSLTHLSVWSLSAEVVLPPHLISLSLCDFTSPNDLVPLYWLPSSLRELVVENDFAPFSLQPGLLPEGLQLLRMSYHSRSPPQPFVLPHSLLALDLCEVWDAMLEDLVQPPGLESLRRNCYVSERGSMHRRRVILGACALQGDAAAERAVFFHAMGYESHSDEDDMEESSDSDGSEETEDEDENESDVSDGEDDEQKE